MTLRSRIAAVAASALLLLTLLIPAQAAHAAAGVTVVNADGTATADPDYATEVTLSGSGFQSITKGFGGVYVLFGWVDDPRGSSWKPSNGGVVGADFRYVPDSESQDNQGFQRFVSFPGSETEGAAHAVMADDGSWSVSMVIPGAVFESRDREGTTSSVDCRETTCGIITIGAHGVKNANNETFTPISFAAPGAGAATTDAAPAAPAAAAAIGALRVGLVSPTVDAGTSIAFTGQGFTPGEQVVATLDNGLVSVGPLAAGAQGEVAGVMPVPRDVRDGTHVIILTGAASGGVAQSDVTIVVPESFSAPTTANETPMWAFVVLASSIVLAFALIVVSVVTSVRRAAKRRRATTTRPPVAKTRPSVAAAKAPPGPDAETELLPVAAGESVVKRAAAFTAALLVAAALALAPGAAASADDIEQPDGGEILVTVPERAPSAGTAIRNAQFRWGLNVEAGSGAYAGGCNFLSAGRAGDVGRAGVVWTEGHGLYAATAGNTRIEKPTATGEYQAATFADRCRDAAGNAVSAASVSSSTGNQAVIDRGTGVLADDGSVEIRWTGSFTVVFYGGMTYWSVNDPVLTIDARGVGRVTATASGFGASMEDLTKWEALPSREIVIAEVRGVDTGGQGGFVTTPLYVGVQVNGAGQAARDSVNEPYWGSFPASFVDYQKLTGQAGYWLTTGGLRDRAKPASPLYISYDANTPIAVTPPVTDAAGSGDPQNTVRTRPASAALAAPAEAAGIPVFPLADASTAMPAEAGLIPGFASGLSNPVVVPLLGTAASLGVAILAVLHLMQLLPWQRPGV